MSDSSGVAIIGPVHGTYSGLSFISDANLYEFGTIIIDPAAVYDELKRLGGPPFSHYAYRQFVDRSDALSAWVNVGHTLIFITKLVTNQFQPNMNTLSLQDTIVALKDFSFRAASGDRIDFCGPPEIEPLLKPHLEDMRYRSVIEGPNMRALLRVRTSLFGEPQLVACTTTFGRGRVICMPPPKGNSSEIIGYLSALTRLPSLLVERPSNLPAWIDNFRTSTENSALAAITDLEQEILARQTKVEGQQAIIAKERELKALFAATGEEFKDAVANALRELGLKCVDGPKSRADLLASDGTRIMVVEAKGLDGGARESNFRQVERWKAEVNSTLTLPVGERDADAYLRQYAEQLNLLGIPPNRTQDCKGLLVVGTHRKTELQSRADEDFPNAVARLLPHSNVCAISGLQLFGLVMLARNDPTRKSALAKALFDTAGVLILTNDWRDFITQAQ